MPNGEKCKEHQVSHCTHSTCQPDNTGSVTINTDGGVSVGIGSGLAIDPTDGSIGVQIGGITVDTY